MATFFKANRKKLFNELGINYGYIAGENFNKRVVICLEDGISVINNSKGKGILTQDEANKIKGLMVKEGNLLNNMEEVAKKIEAMKLPENWEPTAVFSICDCENPVVHGHINRGDGVKVAHGVTRLDDALFICSDAVEKGSLVLHDAVTVLQEMRKVGLPLDLKDWDRLYNEVPTEKKARHASKVLMGMMTGFSGPTNEDDMG